MQRKEKKCGSGLKVSDKIHVAPRAERINGGDGGEKEGEKRENGQNEGLIIPDSITFSEFVDTLGRVVFCHTNDTGKRPEVWQWKQRNN